MGFVLDTPETFGQESIYLKTPGKYHLFVSDVFEGSLPTKQDGTPGKTIAGFSVVLSVLHGPEKDKICNLAFRNGDYSHKDQGASARRKQAAFLFACDLIQPASLGKQVEVDLHAATGSQVVAELDVEEYTDDQGRAQQSIQLSWANIYHVDDPRCAKVEKDQKSIDSIPKENRHDAKHFEAIVSKGKKAVAKPRITNSDLEDLDF
jgi:hypothetical protein